jgi:FkbH-like protein
MIQNKMIDELRKHLESGEFESVKECSQKIWRQKLKPHELIKINKLIAKYNQSLEENGWACLKIAILGSSSTQYISLGLPLGFIANDRTLKIYEAQYNTYNFEALDINSELYKFGPDIVLIATDTNNIKEFPLANSSKEEVVQKAQKEIEKLQFLWKIINKNTSGNIIQTNFVTVEEQILGRLEYKYVWSQNSYVQILNKILWEHDGNGVRVLNVQNMAQQIGLKDWYDPKMYHMAKFAFNPKHTQFYINNIISATNALQGRSKKCLVTDLDNTLWGGVIGDHGISGIELGSISPAGEAYQAFCSYLKKLKDRGVILAINSKNNHEIAVEVFKKHKEMPLKESDFATIFCNWEAKSSNLEKISKELNIGLDSMVFIDDSPVECELVRSKHPAVTVIEMSGEPSYFIRIIEDLQLFENLAFTDEDMARGQSYISKAKVEQLRANSENIDEFLIELKMKSLIHESKITEIQRIEQLLSKTNQYNMTGLKPSRDDIINYISSTDKFCISCYLEDKYTNYGLVSVMIGSFKKERVTIENWVMSCRVFSRGLEEHIFKYLIKEWGLNGYAQITANFVSTSKNSYAKNVYGRLGLNFMDELDGQLWEGLIAEEYNLISYVNLTASDI